MHTGSSYDPDSLRQEFDLLMTRAGITVASDAYVQMLMEYAQLRAEMDMIHGLAQAHAGILDLHHLITEGRVEE